MPIVIKQKTWVYTEKGQRQDHIMVIKYSSSTEQFSTMVPEWMTPFNAGSNVIREDTQRKVELAFFKVNKEYEALYKSRNKKKMIRYFWDCNNYEWKGNKVHKQRGIFSVKGNKVDIGFNYIVVYKTSFTIVEGWDEREVERHTYLREDGVTPLNSEDGYFRNEVELSKEREEFMITLSEQLHKLAKQGTEFFKDGEDFQERLDGFIAEGGNFLPAPMEDSK